jgi:signal transduction histidine kinase
MATAAEQLARLRKRVSELERRNAELLDLSAMAAHELRAPLIAVQHYAAQVSERLAESMDDAAREDLDAVIRGATRARILADTLLEHAHASRRSPVRNAVDLAEVATECIALLRPEIATRGVRLSIAPLPVVQADHALLASVLQNLLVNALRYGPRSGGTIRLGATRQRGRWRITVESDGAPIDEEERSRIFAPYRRGRDERRATGVGLGLAICRAIVDRYGGRVGVDPLERGNRFFFTLPD